jgi:hypothetical protein
VQFWSSYGLWVTKLSRRIDGALMVNDFPEAGMLPLCLLKICKNALFSNSEHDITYLDVCI